MIFRTNGPQNVQLCLETTGFDSLADLLETEDPATAAADLPRESRWAMNDVSLLARNSSQAVDSVLR